MSSDRIAVKIADNIVSPLGFTTAENLAAVKAGSSVLQRYDQWKGVPEPFVASMFQPEQIEAAYAKIGNSKPLTRFEKLALLSIRNALAKTDVDVTSSRTLLILSTTKGNVDLLRQQQDGVSVERVSLPCAAKAIAQQLGMPNEPLVVSNACISGACAQITAARLIAAGCYDDVVVCGADELSPFIISGFQSLKALTDQPCRPFDEDRTGINLGEAAATIIYREKQKATKKDAKGWTLVAGAIRNDAFHISGPSKTADGCYQALQSVIQNVRTDDIALINAHGTATFFNDEMESVAIHRAGLDSVPVNSLKGYFGHTMGAAGVLETIITAAALDEQLIIGTRGFQTLGTSRQINVIAQHQPTDKQSFVKLISGFGGCNAAMLFINHSSCAQ